MHMRCLVWCPVVSGKVSGKVSGVSGNVRKRCPVVRSGGGSSPDENRSCGGCHPCTSYNTRTRVYHPGQCHPHPGALASVSVITVMTASTSSRWSTSTLKAIPGPILNRESSSGRVDLCPGRAWVLVVHLPFFGHLY